LTPTDIAARLRAGGDTEAADAIEHLKGIIRRNRATFEAVKADRDQWRGRATRAESLLDTVKADLSRDPLSELFGSFWRVR
jgi:propanediol dehydratase large subunit